MSFIRKVEIGIAIVAVTITGTIQGYDECATSQAGCQTPCAPVCCPRDCGTYFLEAEVLFLRPSEGGLASVCDSTTTTDTTIGGVTYSTLDGTGRDPRFDWDWGFRIGAGYEFPCSPCDIGVYWTHLNSCTGRGSTGNDHRWKIDFDYVDVLFSCSYYVSPCFVLTPFGGLRWANIDQKLRTNFITTVDGTSTLSTGSAKDDFWGVGPLVGVDGEWAIGCGCSFYGDIDIGILYGRFHTKSNSTDVTATIIDFDNVRMRSQAIQFVLDAGAGIRYRTCVCCMPLVFQLGLEHHQYFNQNRFCGYGDLYIDGVSLGVGLSY